MPEKIKLSKRGQSLFASVPVLTQYANLDTNRIAQAIARTAFAGAVILDANLAKAVTQINTQLEKNGEQSPAELVEFEAAKIKNAKITVSISDDNMSASAKIITACGGEKLSLLQIKKACVEQGIRFGLSKTAVKRLLTKINHVAPGTELEEIIVKGKSPIDGENAYIANLVPIYGEQGRKHSIHQDGTFDLRDVGAIQAVEIGMPVARKINATQGESGQDVLGNKLEAVPGQDIELTATEGTEVDPNDAMQLISTRQGILRRDGERIVVDEILSLEQVNAKQGHVRFNGSVVIKKDVDAGMEIDVTGNVMIGGYVESAVIKAGGNIAVAGGCSGHQIKDDEQGRLSCRLISGGHVHVKFANHVQIRAMGEINIESECLHCQIDGHDLIVGKVDKPQGKCIGGKINLTKVLIAGHIGSNSNIKTRINMNKGYDVFIEKERQLWDKIKELEEKHGTLIGLLQHQVTARDKLILEKRLAVVESKIGKYRDYKKLLIKKRNAFLETIVVRATRAFYPNVAIKFADTDHKFDKQTTVSELVFREGQVQVAKANV